MALATPNPSFDSDREELRNRGSISNRVATRLNPVQRGAMQQYQRAQIETASPTRLVVMLYEGAIRFCSLAQDAMRKGDIESQNTNLIRSQRIVGELLASLNRAEGGEVADNLSRIYTHILEELVHANLYDEPHRLDHVNTLLTEMCVSWRLIDRAACGEGGPQESAELAARDSDTPSRGGVAEPGDARTARPLNERVYPAPAPTREGGAAPSRLGDRLA